MRLATVEKVPQTTMNPRVKTDCWPTPEQELLLRAALLRGPQVIAAWDEWRSSVHPDRLDAASYRLLPQLYKNVHAHGIRGPLVDKLKGVYRLTWYKNQISFRHMAALLRSLHDLGIDTLVLKGVPLVLLYYRDYGLRPMADFDVLVRRGQALTAVRFLQGSGWVAADSWPETLHETYLSVGHGFGFRDAAGRRFDLHWHVFPECCRPDADDDLWDGAVTLKIDEVSSYTLNSTDHLLHVCAHGVRWDPLPPFRWIADALAIINGSTSELDWQRLLAQTEQRRLLCPLKAALTYLRDRFDAPVPAEVLRRLKNMPTSRLERIEYRYKSRNYGAKPFGYLPLHWFNYLRLEPGAGSKYNLPGFAAYLQRLCGVNSLWRLAAYAISRRARRAWRATLEVAGRWAQTQAQKR